LKRNSYNSHELNQLGWWSNWSSLIWFTKCCCALASIDNDEPLFNHVEILDPGVDLGRLLPKIETVFLRRGRTPCFYIRGDEGREAYRSTLLANGYSSIDSLSIMEIASASFRSNKEVDVEVIDEDGIEQWCETYILSFYEEKIRTEPVLRAVRKSRRGRRTRLILARYRDSPAGAAALYMAGGLCGAYCVGTVPRFRNIGVASTMLEFAYELSNRAGKRLALQTALSDSVEPFYIARGFRRIYLKEVLSRPQRREEK
jgi:GNAT superfamily N-acetyltransferase